MLKTPEDRLAEIKLYELVIDELQKGKEIKGLWAKAFSESDGDEEKTRARYIKLRVEMMGDEWRALQKSLKRKIQIDEAEAIAREQETKKAEAAAQKEAELVEKARRREEWRRTEPDPKPERPVPKADWSSVMILIKIVGIVAVVLLIANTLLSPLNPG